jgi:hypothetical protein
MMPFDEEARPPGASFHLRAAIPGDISIGDNKVPFQTGTDRLKLQKDYYGKMSLVAHPWPVTDCQRLAATFLSSLTPNEAWPLGIIGPARNDVLHGHRIVPGGAADLLVEFVRLRDLEHVDFDS